MHLFSVLFTLWLNKIQCNQMCSDLILFVINCTSQIWPCHKSDKQRFRKFEIKKHRKEGCGDIRLKQSNNLEVKIGLRLQYIFKTGTETHL